MNTSRLDAMIMKQEGLAKLDRTALERIMLAKLNALLKREKERAGFYRDLPASLSSLQELSDLPFTSDDDLRRHYTGMFLGSSGDVEKVMTEKTSGTSGEAKRVFYTARDIEHTVDLFAAGIGEMASAAETVIIGMPYSGPDSLADLIARGISGCGAVPLQLKEGTIREQCRQYHELQPDHAIDLPISLLARARCYEAIYGRGSLPLKGALISADLSPHSVIRALREEFGLLVYPHYGSREMGLGGAIACSVREGMHLREHQIIAEIIDAEGNVLPDGEWGELVITTVDMEALPLIRFRTGDRTRFIREQCACGSICRRLDHVRRNDDDALMLEQTADLLYADRNVLDLTLTERSGQYELDLMVLPGCRREDLTEILCRLPSDIRSISLSEADFDTVCIQAGKRKIYHM